MQGSFRIHRIVKYLVASSRPKFWPVIAKGVVPAVEHLSAIARLRPNTIIDVGANKGQFAAVARYLFPGAQIHAFEPLERERRLLASIVTPPIEIYPVAIGETGGSADFFVASRADSSSLLRPGAGQEKAYGVALSSTISVQVARLADLVDFSGLRRPTLMKIDVQGGELSVLKGAGENLSLVDVIYCEASFVPLYDGQPLAHELIAYLGKQGFVLRGAFNQSNTAEFGPTQADLLFVRSDRTL